MNKYLSDKLRAISFLSMIMVVYLHAYNLTINMNDVSYTIEQGYNSFIQEFFSQGITRIAVPIFFIISGYLFFLNLKDGRFSEFLSKYRKRINTLVIPYLLWSIFGLLFYLILQSNSISEPFFTKELIRDYSFNQLLSTIFIHPIPYQLWFIRDLVVLVFFSPIIYWIIKYFKFYGVLLFLIAWVFQFNFVIFSNEALLFFVIGGFIAIKGINLQNAYLKRRYLSLIISWFLIILLKTTLTYINIENGWLLLALHKASIIVGLMATWSLYDRLFKNKDISKSRYFFVFQFTFFLYVFHEPILTILKKSFYFILGETEFSSLIIYFSAPAVTILLAIIIGFYLRKFIPKFYYLTTGGR